MNKVGPKVKPIKWEVDPVTGCWNCTSPKPSYDGYPRIVRTDFKGRIHRHIFEMFNGKQPTNIHIRHTCDNPTCINPNHLIPGTHLENMQDKKRGGINRNSHGENHGRAILTEEDVINILRDKKTTYRELSNKYNVSLGAIQLIKQRINWKHLKIKNISL